MSDSNTRVGKLVVELQSTWRDGRSPDLVNLLASLPREDAEGWATALVADAECMAERGLAPTLGRYLERFPWLAPGSRAVQEVLAVEVANPGGDGSAAVHEAVLVARYGEPFRADIRLVLDLLGSLQPEPERTDPVAGQRLGKYELRGLLGRGSFGQVWLAWDHELACFVALKLLPPTADADRRMSSLLVEARAASGLNHPNVIGVRAAGRFPAPDDWLYIDMQVCGDPAPTPEEPKAIAIGTPLPEYRRSHRPEARAIAGLMADVCRGVVAAHAQGVVHCDLKPANVLVTPSGRAMVADFGLSASSFMPAIDLDAARADATLSIALRTLGGQVIRGTPAYMSPEQARGETARPISDVYALGAILYWLLTGTDPIALSGDRGLKDLLEEIGDVSRPGPALPHAAHPTLARICARAMAKEPTGRYQSVAAMLADLEALTQRRVPPTVGPDSSVQPLALWTRRNALPVGIAAAAMVGLATLAGVAMHQRGLAVERAELAQAAGRKAELAAAEEKKRAEELKLVSEYQSEMLGQVDPTTAGVRMKEDLKKRFDQALAAATWLSEEERTTERETFARLLTRVNGTDAATALIDTTILTPGVAAIETKFKDQPVVAAALMQVLADEYRKRGLYHKALPLQEAALATRRRVLGEAHEDTLRSIGEMGGLLLDQGKLAEAESYHREALDKYRRAFGEQHPEMLTAIGNMALTLLRQGKLSEAEPYYREALEKKRRVLGEEHPDTLTSLGNMGVLLREQGRLSEAEPYYRGVLEKRRRVLGDSHPATLLSISNMAVLLKDLGKLSDAERYLREALEARRRVLGEEHPDTLTSINNVGVLLLDRNKLSEAEPYIREALEKSRRVLGKEHPETLIAINNMGFVLQAQSKLSDAESYFREALEVSRRVLGEEHPDTLNLMHNMGGLMQSQGKMSEAEQYVREALERRRSVLGEDHPDTVSSINAMGFLLRTQGKLSEAEPYIRDGLEISRRLLGARHPNTLNSIKYLVTLLRDQDKLTEAEPYAREVLQISRQVLGEAHPDTLSSINLLGALLRDQGKLSEAEAYAREVLDKSRQVLGEEHRSTLTSISNLGLLLQLQGKLAEAAPYLREALDKRRRVLGEEHPNTLISVTLMLRLRLDQSKPQEALDLALPFEPAARKAFTGSTARGLADFLIELGRARVSLGYDSERFQLAEANFLEAHAIFVVAKDRGPTHRDTLGCVQGLVDLYTAWDKAEPGKGYDAKAAEWKAKLDAAAQAQEPPKS